jgi:hypothetical protein
MANASYERGYEIKYDPDKQIYIGIEKPNGQQFEDMSVGRLRY